MDNLESRRRLSEADYTEVASTINQILLAKYKPIVIREWAEYNGLSPEMVQEWLEHDGCFVCGYTSCRYNDNGYCPDAIYEEEEEPECYEAEELVIRCLKCKYHRGFDCAHEAGDLCRNGNMTKGITIGAYFEREAE